MAWTRIGKATPRGRDSPEGYRYLNVKRTICPDNRGLRFSHGFFQMVESPSGPAINASA